MTRPELHDDPGAAGDWTAPGVYRSAPDVYRIPLPLPNDGLRAVNVYAIADDAGWTLVDAGWALAESRELLAGALDVLGSGLADVRRFLVTHSHRDHYTQAVTLRKEFGAQVLIGAGERPNIDEVVRPGHTAWGVHGARLHRAGADELATEMDAEPRGERDMAGWERPDGYLADRAVVTVGPPAARRRLEVVETPGHTRGHVVFADEASDLLFAGDHVLPRITPSIGFEPRPTATPLGDFLVSLQLLKDRPDAALLPAHGPVGRRVHERVDELLEHHADRLDATLKAAEEGRSTAFEVAGALTWTRRERTLPELDRFNMMMAVLETQAHLDLLAQRGILTTEDHGVVTHYATP
ncbi:MBL fold metallo-hydrolase [Pseudonocardia sp. T1-2H]|uniref:MBL fold metallo-hydrolase n=1 Tax=Pseudonocardia sp. T1-2H TaxID=3128899 RepID=UPI0031010451